MDIKIEWYRNWRECLPAQIRNDLIKEVIRYFKASRVCWLSEILMEIKDAEPLPLCILNEIEENIERKASHNTAGAFSGFSFSILEITLLDSEKKLIDTQVLMDKLTKT